MITGMPFWAASSADCNLDFIPPVERVSARSLTQSNTALSIEESIDTRWELPPSIGCCKPSVVLRRISASASIRMATRAASTSLSPNLISSVEMVSFSLMMGMILCDIRCRRVLRAFRWRSWSLSTSWVSKTCPIPQACVSNNVP